MDGPDFPGVLRSILPGFCGLRSPRHMYPSVEICKSCDVWQWGYCANRVVLARSLVTLFGTKLYCKDLISLSTGP